jgi:hypothetical protein
MLIRVFFAINWLFLGDYNYNVNKITPLKNVKSGSFIGEREFATNSLYEFSLRAVKFTSIIYIRLLILAIS